MEMLGFFGVSIFPSPFPLPPSWMLESKQVASRSTGMFRVRWVVEHWMLLGVEARRIAFELK